MGMAERREERQDERPDTLRETGEEAIKLIAVTLGKANVVLDVVAEIARRIGRHGVELFAAKDGEEFPFSFGVRPGKPKPTAGTE